MNYHKAHIQGLIVFEPNIFEDERGFFYESFRADIFEQATNTTFNLLQENHSKSRQGVLRGLHYQAPPFEQDKLIKVIKGEILDIAVDLRQNSSTFLQYHKIILNSDNHKQLYIPKGFAHGFLALSDCELVYKTSQIYKPSFEKCIRFDDPKLNIDWGKIDNLVVSAKDLQGEYL
jgi:dTDP-4-dehydrorhamnose 3,5-epimerase